MARYIVVVCRSIFLGLVLVVSVNQAWSNEAKPDLVLYVAEIPGYMGGPASRPGILVELVNLVADETGYRIETKIVPWARAVNKVKTTNNTLVPGFSRLPEREVNYSWIAPQMAAQSAFLSLTHKINSFEEAKTLNSIGAHRATSHQLELVRRGFTNVVSVDNVKQTIKMLHRRRIDAWYGDVNEYFRRWRDYHGEGAEKLFVGRIQLSEQIWLAGNKNLPKKVIRDLQIGMKAVIEKGYRRGLIKKYFGREE